LLLVISEKIIKPRSSSAAILGSDHKDAEINKPMTGINNRPIQRARRALI
jgi:hypothetical protein